MTGVPIGPVVIAVVAAVLLALTAGAGSGALHRLRRSGDAPTVTPPRLAADPGAAGLAHVVRAVGEAVVAVGLTIALAGVWRSWWQVALVALVAIGLLLAGTRVLAPSIGWAHPVGTLVLATPVIGAARIVLAPAQGLLRALRAREDGALRDVAEQVGSTEPIEDDEREMVRSVLELGDTITRAVMVPRTEMITLTAGTGMRKALSLFLRSGYSRVPVVGESVDDLVGVLYLKDVVRRLHTVEGSDDDAIDELVRPPVFVPESKPVDDLLRELQRGSSHLAVVVDEFGGIAGLVTVEDAVEEIVGEVVDEHDRSAPEVEALGDGSFRIPARLPLDELGELFDIDIEDDDVDTAGGLLAKALGKVPLAGSSAEVAGLMLQADRVEGRRKQVATLLVARATGDGGVG